ncbi:Tripartite-type tricarboxylate transporter, receptor component TctC [Cupriavidus oxalaticus]|uniref:Bug family tripartite tricarboxylate transporter substrate binding protein n=1 Tax=Cupriavidus oxalaticus TaxID=96344 RepID=UPI003F73907E
MYSRRSILFALPALGALWSIRGLAQAYPSRPIRFVVPIAPGSATDLVARQVSASLNKLWSQSVVVENRPGAGGVIGTDVVAKAQADGYTLLFTLSSHFTNPWLEKTPYDAVADFEPVARLVSTALVMVTAVDSKFKTVRDVIAAAKREPRSVSYASAGEGTASHMCGALLNTIAGIEMNHAPYKNGSQAMIETASGQVQVAFSGQAALPLIRAGKLRVLAVTSAQRSALMPDAPPMNKAAGIDGYDFSSPIWAFAPKGTPAAVVTKLSDALGVIVASPEFKAFCSAQALDPDYQPAATVRAGWSAEAAKWRRLVQLIRA